MLALMDLDDMLPELGTYRPLKRVEYDRLVAEGCFDDEKVELLFGMVVPMVPIDPAHDTSAFRVQRLLFRQLDDRAEVRVNASFAASEISEPVPDIFVTAERRLLERAPGCLLDHRGRALVAASRP
jgi:hypothetical protein